MSSTMKYMGLVSLLMGFPMATANIQSCYIDCMHSKVHGEASHRACVQECFSSWPMPSGFVTSIKPFLISSVNNTTIPEATSAASMFTIVQGPVSVPHPMVSSSSLPEASTSVSSPGLQLSWSTEFVISTPGILNTFHFTRWVPPATHKSIPTTHLSVSPSVRQVVSAIPSQLNITSGHGPVPIPVPTGPVPVSIPTASLPFTSGHGPVSVSVQALQDAIADACTASRSTLSFFDAPSSLPFPTGPGPVSVRPSSRALSSVAVTTSSKASFRTCHGPVETSGTANESYSSCLMECISANGSDVVIMECLEKCDEIPYDSIGWLLPLIQDGPNSYAPISARQPLPQSFGAPESEIISFCHRICPVSSDPDYITCMMMCQDAWSELWKGPVTKRAPATASAARIPESAILTTCNNICPAFPGPDHITCMVKCQDAWSVFQKGPDSIVSSAPAATVLVVARQQLLEDSNNSDFDDFGDLPYAALKQCYNQCVYPDPVAGTHPKLCIGICLENWIKNHPFGTSAAPRVPEATKLAARKTSGYTNNDWKVCCNRILTCENTCKRWPVEQRDWTCVNKCWHLDSLNKMECQGKNLRGQCCKQNSNIINENSQSCP